MKVIDFTFRPVLSSDQSLAEQVQDAVEVLKRRRKGTSIENICDLMSQHGHESGDVKAEIASLLDQNVIAKVDFIFLNSTSGFITYQQKNGYLFVNKTEVERSQSALVVEEEVYFGEISSSLVGSSLVEARIVPGDSVASSPATPDEHINRTVSFYEF